MQGRNIPVIIGGCTALAFIIAFFLVPGAGILPVTSQKPTVYILYSTAGSMPQLLNTGQVDAFFDWQPYVAMSDQGKLGKIITYSEGLPPDHYWADKPCCVFVMSDKFVRQEPELARILSLLTAAGIQYINNNEDKAEQITANWIFGSGNLLIAGIYLDPMEVEQESFPTLHFVNKSSLLQQYNETRKQNQTSTGQDIFIPGTPVPLTMHGEGNLASPEKAHPLIRFGYLSTDHHAPLFVLASDPDYFLDKYGFALVPVNPGDKRPNQFNLISGNKTVAQVQLIIGQSGGGLMTNMGQGVIDAAYVGSIPAQNQIGFGNPAHVIEPLHTGGSALVAGNSAPCTDWNDFTAWATTRSAAGKPLIVATVQSSIQEDMITTALESEGFEVRLYGT
jgi:ABC-type nitrate/sulfonate/bicarbonate transport system substrate-binding protein